MTLYSRDTNIGGLIEPEQAIQVELGVRELQSRIEQLIDVVKQGARIVTCPVVPLIIPGIATGAAYTANDAMGTPFTIKVPKYGILYSATFLDMDDEGSQMDFAIFKQGITTSGDNSAWAPTDTDLLHFLTLLQFATFSDHGTGRTAELVNIGRAYSAISGLLTIQAIARSTPTIAAGNLPRLQLQILSGDPDFIEGED